MDSSLRASSATRELNKGAKLLSLDIFMWAGEQYPALQYGVFCLFPYRRYSLLRLPSESRMLCWLSRPSRCWILTRPHLLYNLWGLLIRKEFKRVQTNLPSVVAVLSFSCCKCFVDLQICCYYLLYCLIYISHGGNSDLPANGCAQQGLENQQCMARQCGGLDIIHNWKKDTLVTDASPPKWCCRFSHYERSFTWDWFLPARYFLVTWYLAWITCTYGEGNE